MSASERPGDLLTAAVMSTAEAFLRESQRLFRPYGLTAAQYNVLNILSDRSEGMSQRELSDELVVDRSNVTGLLDRMENAGWVRRSDHPSDRRVYQVVMTPSGRRLWERVHPLYQEAVAQITSKLSARRMRDCLKVLEQLESAASEWKSPKG
jgi:DNA-binding MarR family transcriptional regulator